MGILSGQSKNDPMHYGEIFSIWSHLAKAKGCLVKYQLLSNHAEDGELVGFLSSMIQHIILPEIQQIEVLLKNNGVTIPPTPQEKPKADYEKIPIGARFTDQEIASCVSNDIAMSLVSSSQIIGVSIHQNISKFFLSHHNELVQYGGKLLNLMKNKGWFVMPPLHRDIPEKH